MMCSYAADQVEAVGLALCEILGERRAWPQARELFEDPALVRGHRRRRKLLYTGP